MIIQDEKITDLLERCGYKLQIFKKHLEVFNRQFFTDHIVGRISTYELYSRSDTDNYRYLKEFWPDFDSYASTLLSRDCQTKHYLIENTKMRDDYINDLIYSYVESHENEPSDEIGDNAHLDALISIWKKDIAKTYDKIEHIKRFVWEYLISWSETKGLDRNYMYNLIFDLANKTFSDYGHIDFDEFDAGGFSCKVIDWDSYQPIIRIQGAAGFFGNLVEYNMQKPLLDFFNQKTITIPKELYKSGLGTLFVANLGKGLFNCLTKTEQIILPCSVNIEWSFWNCRNLKNIDVIHSYQGGKLYSIDGVLFSYDKKELIAYPNKHGDTYSIPEGVRSIKKFAFKDCPNIIKLHIPKSLRHIGINAFYRCTNLKEIISDSPCETIQIDGFSGNYGDVNPIWIFTNTNQRISMKDLLNK